MKTRPLINLALVLGLIVFILAGLAVLPLPFTRDQGIYAYNAWRWLGDAALYRDTFDHKGPLLYIIYAAFLKLSGGAMWGPNLADLMARALTVVLAWAVGRSVLTRRAADLGAVLTALPLFGVFNSCWWNAQAETFIMPILAAATWLVADVDRAPRRSRRFLSGVLIAMAAMIKINALAHGLFLLGWLVLAPSPEDGREGKSGRAGAPLALVAGLAACFVAWIVYLAAAGSLGPMWEATVVFNSFHAGQALLDLGAPVLHVLTSRFETTFSLIPLAVLLLALPPRQCLGRRGHWFVLAWLLVSFLQLFMQGRFFLYHFLLLAAPMGLAAGAGLDHLMGAEKSRRRLIGRAFTGLLLVWLIYTFTWTYYLIQRSYRTWDHVRGRITLAEYYSRFSEDDAQGVGDFNLLAAAAAAHYLSEHTPPGSTVLIFGFEPIVNYLAARPSPTRFEIDYPLTFTPRSDRAVQTRQAWRAEFMAGLRHHPPAMVVLLDHDQNAVEPESSLTQAREFTEFWEWLNQNYVETDKIEDFHFYGKR